MDQMISASEAEQALRNVTVSRERMRNVIRSHHGHAYLWVWGVITVFDCVGVDRFGVYRMQLPTLIANIIGMLSSVFIGIWSARHIRMKTDRRFVAVSVLIIVMHLLVIPAVIGWPQDPRRQFTYIMLFWTEIYVVAGIWFSNYLLWSGAVCIAFALLGLFAFPGIFWIWSAITIGGTLIGSGFYVRFFWR